MEFVAVSGRSERLWRSTTSTVLSSMSNVDFETWYPVKLFIQLVLFWRMNQFWKKSYLVHCWSILVTLKIKEMWKWIQKIEDSESFQIH